MSALRRYVPTVLWIVLVWLALWGDLSWANVVGGVLVAVLVLVAVRLPAREATYRLSVVPASAYLARFAKDLVVATAQVARQVFWPVERLRPAILEVPMQGTDPLVLALVANSITLTPGTMTLDVDERRGLLWVHVLHLEEGGDADLVGDARSLERLGARALGVDLAAAPAPVRTEEGRP